MRLHRGRSGTRWRVVNLAARKSSPRSSSDFRQLQVLRDSSIVQRFAFAAVQRVQGCAIDFHARLFIVNFSFYLQRLKPKSLRHSDRVKNE